MDSYWQLIRLNSSGSCYSYSLPQVKAWMTQLFTDLPNDATDRTIQQFLFSTYRKESPESPLAQLALRCYISHQVRLACQQLATQFGDKYGFTQRDLLPFVLDDEGKKASDIGAIAPSKNSAFYLSVLHTYDPRKAQLNTWTARLVRNHPDLNRALLDLGLYRASNWAILNDTTLPQLQRIFIQYHLQSETEILAAGQLLQRYHAVYRRDRIQQRLTGRCRPPTEEQLARIDDQHPPNTVLSQLDQLASKLREYRTYVRGGNPIPFQGDEIDWNQIPTQISVDTGADDPQQDFLAAYRLVLKQCLASAIAQVIRNKITKLKQRQPPKDQVYVNAMHLFHCQGLSMGQIAQQTALKSQVNVSRLLMLTRFRAEVRHLLIPQLQSTVHTLAVDYISAERLRQIDKQVETLLTESIDDMMKEDTAKNYAPQKRSGPSAVAQESKSLFARQLCQTIHQFLPQSI